MISISILIGMIVLFVLARYWQIKYYVTQTKLHDAVIHNDHAQVLALLNQGCNVNAISHYGNAHGGWAPIHLVRSAQIARLLLDRGADPNQLSIHKWTPLYIQCDRYLAGQTSYEVILVLINCGAYAGEKAEHRKVVENTLLLLKAKRELQLTDQELPPMPTVITPTPLNRQLAKNPVKKMDEHAVNGQLWNIR